MADIKTMARDNRGRLVAIGLLIIVALFGAYRYSVAEESPAYAAAAGTEADSGALPAAADSSGSTGGAGSVGCAMGCCGGGSSTPVEGAATVDAGVQKIAVDASAGFSPNVLKLQAGVPAEITFSQGGGCTASVYSAELGFQADLTGGAQTVQIPALQPGTYGFACGMDMVSGQIVVE